MTRVGLLCLAVLALPHAALALTLSLPERAREAASDQSKDDTVVLPLSIWRDGAIRTVDAAGTVSRRAWQVVGSAATTLQLITPLKDQLVAQGYGDLFECDDAQCGGFDFRFALDLLPEPDMHVDLGDYRYLVASKDTDGGTEWASIVVSRGTSTGYIHLTAVGVGTADDPETPTDPVVTEIAPEDPPDTKPPRDLLAALEASGRVALDDLSFGTGSSALGEDDFASLQTLAVYLLQNPDVQVVLVGHTDADGTLSNNIALSKRRATSVLNRLVERYGVAPRQLAAEGVGYLSPRAPNDTPEGRELNRRVEAIRLAAP